MILLTRVERKPLEVIEQMGDFPPETLPKEVWILVDCIHHSMVQFLFWDNCHHFLDGWGFHFFVKEVMEFNDEQSVDILLNNDVVDCRDWCFDMPEMMEMVMEVKGLI
jgi:hypothetical protein